MARNERQRVQTRANNHARNAAMRRLIQAHREEYRKLYIEECDKRGVTPAPTTGLLTKRERVEPIIAEVLASGILDGVEVPESVPLSEQFDPPPTPVVVRQSMTRAEQLDAAAAGVAHRPARPDYVPVPPPPF